MNEKRAIEIIEDVFCREAAGCLYYLAPDHRPRKVEIIMDKAIKAFREKSRKGVFGIYVWKVEEDQIDSELHEIFFGIPEFIELNLTQIEYEAGLTAEDALKSNQIQFVSRYTVTDEESVRHDFIDLDAYIQNVSTSLWPMNERTKKNAPDSKTE